MQLNRILLAACALPMMACLEKPPRPPVATVRVDIDNTNVELGGVVKVKAVAIDADGNVLADVSNTLTVAQTAVATVCGDKRCDVGEDATNCAADCDSSSGGAPSSFKLVAVAAGTTEITATAGGGDVPVSGSAKLTVSCPTASGPTMHAGRISKSEVWTAQGSPHIVTGDLSIGGSEACTSGDAGCVCDQSNNCRRIATVTVGSCAEVKVAPGTSIVVGKDGPGALRTLGGPDGKVQFSSNAPTPAAGDWKGIVFDSLGATDATLLRYTDILHAGAKEATPCGPSAQSAALRVVGGGTDGTPTLSAVKVAHSAGHGIMLVDSGLSGQSGQIVIEDTACAPWRATAEHTGGIPIVSNPGDYGKKGEAYIEVLGGNVTKTSSWRVSDIEYHILGSVIVGSQEGRSPKLMAVFVLRPGVTLKFEPGTSLTIGPTIALPAQLNAGPYSREVADPVTLTSAAPAGQEKAGDWVGLVLGPGAENTLIQTVRILYAGAPSGIRGFDGSYTLDDDRGGLIILTPSPGQLRDTSVEDSAGWGVVLGNHGKLPPATCGGGHPCDPSSDICVSANTIVGGTGIGNQNCDIFKSKDTFASGVESAPNPLSLASPCGNEENCTTDRFALPALIRRTDLCNDGGTPGKTPPLEWSYDGDAPAGAKDINSWAVVFSALGTDGRWAPKWVIYNLDKSSTSLPAGLTDDASKPAALSGATIVGEYGKAACPSDLEACKELAALTTTGVQAKACQGLKIVQPPCPAGAKHLAPPQEGCEVATYGLDRAELCLQYRRDCELLYRFTVHAIATTDLSGGAGPLTLAEAISKIGEQTLGRADVTGRIVRLSSQ